jgi:hypothetical protein
MENAEALCMGCMEPKKHGSCPNPHSCGWTEGSGNQSQVQLQPRTELKGRYVIGKSLGQGGFGITYLSWDLEQYKKRAVKEYFPSSFATRDSDRRTVTFSSPETRDPYQYGLNKFTQEARTLERLRGHANIVSVIEFFPANNTGYIVMEFLDGITLDSYLANREGQKISFDECLQILVPVMDALREVHAANFAHRDVSPDNIVLTKSGQIKLIDFGAAKQAARDKKTQQLILKPGFTPEEQYRSEGVAGPWSDVYALGATIYRCITGNRPPDAPDRLSEDTLAPPRKSGAKMPAQSENALLRALAVRAKDRYQTISDFQRDLVPVIIRDDDKVRDDGKRVDVVVPTGGDGILRQFRAFWILGTALMFVGSFFRSDKDARWLLAVLGILVLAITIPLLVRARGRARDNKAHFEYGLLFFLLLLTVPGILIATLAQVPIAFVGVALLLPGLFIAGTLIAKTAVKTPSSDVPETVRVSEKVGLRILAGEDAGSIVQIGNDPIVIGRDPSRANLIIPSVLVSGAHAKVWANNGALNIEDLQSRNGTYVRRSSGTGEWRRLTASEVLLNGDQFYLSDAATAMFEVTSAVIGG